MLNTVLAVAAAYFVGAIPFGLIIGMLRGIDIRRYGSGNVGATNTMRVAGKAAGIAALLLDIAKGIIAVTAVAPFFYELGVLVGRDLFFAMMALSAVCGHIWNIFLKFKGGKGVATTAGILMALYPRLFFIGIIVWITSLCLSKYVSLSSVVASLSLPIAAAIFGYPWPAVGLCLTLFVICSYKHKGNLARIMKGEESRVKDVWGSKHK